MPTRGELLTTVERQKCEKDFLFFTRYFFCKREGIKFKVNWHHRKIADTLMNVVKGHYNGKILIINVPPGSSKTEMAFISFVPWCLALNPRCRFMHLSYSDRLVELNSMKAKDIVMSEEFQRMWPLEMKSDTKSKKLWQVLHENKDGDKRGGGEVMASTLSGMVTGFRAGHMEAGFTGAIIIDDPLKVKDSYSTVARMNANELIKSTVKSRRANPDVPIIMIMQRLHEVDPTGAALCGDYGLPVELVKIPAIIEEDGVEKSYWEYKEPIKELQKARDIDPYVFYGQYMQEPAPIGNGEFKKEGVQFFNPEHKDFSCREMNLYIMYDPANTKKDNADWTAIVVIGLAPDKNYYILDLVRDRLNPTERVNKLINMHKKWNRRGGKPPTVCIEQYGMMTDSFYIQEVQNQINYRFPTVEVAGKLKKEDRIRRMVPDWDNNRIYLPDKILYNDYKNEVRELVGELIEDELMLFPVGKNDDMIDAMSRIYDVNAFFPEEQVHYLAGGETLRDSYNNYNNQDYMSW